MLEAQIYQDEYELAVAMVEASIAYWADDAEPNPVHFLSEIILRGVLRGKCFDCEEKCGEYCSEVLESSVAGEVREKMMRCLMLTDTGSEN